MELFERLLDLRNDVGLLSEEWDPHAQRQLGNTPQAFSHVGLVNTEPIPVSVDIAPGCDLRAETCAAKFGNLPNFGGFPAIPGRETFKGVSFHSAEWRHDVDLTGKRVVCIGTGASALQFLPHVAELDLYLGALGGTLPAHPFTYAELEARSGSREAPLAA